ncbi:MAG: hypothetical protein RSD09_00560 [Bacilli bacterium]
MSEFEVQELFKVENNKDIVINNSSYSYSDNNIETAPLKETKVEFFDSNSNNDDSFYNSKSVEKESNITEEDKSQVDESVSSNTIESTSDNIYSMKSDDDSDKVINEDKNDNKDTEIAIHDFKVGNKVNILSGGMTGQTGIIINISDDKKIIDLEVDLFGRKTNLHLNYTEVEKSLN